MCRAEIGARDNDLRVGLLSRIAGPAAPGSSAKPLLLDRRTAAKGSHNGADGGVTNVIAYVDLATLGNATDFGDLSAAVVGAPKGLNGNSTRGLISGGNGNTIEYITIQTTGNFNDFGAESCLLDDFLVKKGRV